jgi:hypothetical protein
MIGPQTPFLDALARKHAIRSYVLAAHAMQGRADAKRDLQKDEKDAGRQRDLSDEWRVCQRLADRLFAAAELEREDPVPPCSHGLMSNCVACQWEDQ